jgi:hypothetical protein
MGCWNETCGVTNLPISYNDEVYFGVIRKNPSDRRPFFYAFDLYMPVTPLIEGKYDDYGGVTMSDDAFDQLFHFVERNPAESNRGNSMRVNDGNYTLPEADSPWMMRKDAYHDMLMKMVLRDMDAFTVADYEEGQRRKFSEKISENMRKWKGMPLGTFVGYDLKRMFDGREATTPPVYKKIFESLDEALAIKGKEHIVVEACLRAVAPLLPIANLYLGLDLLRKMLVPTPGAGSQAWNFHAYRVYGDFIAKAATDYQKEIGWDEDSGLDHIAQDTL